MTTPIPRDLEVDLSTVPRHWNGGGVTATALCNGINLLFPHGERFFVRSVHHFLDRITDPVLRAQIKGFSGQEGRHAHAHDGFNDVLRAQGFAIDRFLERYIAISTWIERHVPAKLNLAGTAAAEHFTAILAHGAFTQGVFDALDPAMRTLLSWHAAEEIEHKAVAFDVLRAIDPSYALRMAGLAYGTVMLGGFWFLATTTLIHQDGLTWRDALAELRARRIGDPVVTRVFGHGIRQYIRRTFHPRDNANEHLAREWFTAHGIAFTEAA